jgi:hypothetical protein
MRGVCVWLALKRFGLHAGMYLGFKGLPSRDIPKGLIQ